MSQIFLADVLGEVGVRALLGEGKMLKFRFNGVCLGEFPVSFNLGSMQEVDVVSLLLSNNHIEVAFNVGQQFSKMPAKKDIGDIAFIMNNQPGLIFLGRRDGQQDGGTYSQYIYTFLKGQVNPTLHTLL